MPNNFENLKAGFFEDSIKNFDSSIEQIKKPHYYDEKLFNEGRNFFKKYKAACIFSMELSVVMGHVFENVLDVMIFTKKTETAKDAFWRYYSTAERVNSWLESDVFDPNSEGHKQIKNTCRIHKGVAQKINKERPTPSDHHWVSQSDMAHVLIGFAGPIVVAPSYFGITNTEELAGYIHTWRVLGNILGIDDKYNPFEGSVAKVQNTIGEVTVETLFPGLENPPKGFWHHTDVICDWAGSRNALITYGLYCFEKACGDAGVSYDKTRFQKMMDNFKLKTPYDYFQFYTSLGIFHYTYRFRLVQIFWNHFVLNRFVIVVILIQLFLQDVVEKVKTVCFKKQSKIQ